MEPEACVNEIAPAKQAILMSIQLNNSEDVKALLTSRRIAC